MLAWKPAVGLLLSLFALRRLSGPTRLLGGHAPTRYTGGAIVSIETFDLVKYVVVFLIPVACSLRWASENGHKPSKVIPFLFGYVAFSAIAYFVIQRFFAAPTYAETANHEALLETLAGWIVVAVVAGLCFLFVLRMLTKRQSQSAGEEARG